MVKLIPMNAGQADAIVMATETATGRYLVLDIYDFVEILYDGNDLREAKRARRERLEDTDGEAYVKFLVREG